MRELPRFIVFSEALTDMIRLSPDSWKSAPGGAGWNVARVMSWLGISSAFAGAISQDCFGQKLKEESEAAGLDMRFLQQHPKSPLLAIVHQTSPVRYFFVGDDSADLHFQPKNLPMGWDDQVEWVYFGGISLTREPLAQRLIELATTLKAKGIKIAYDPNFRVTMDESYDATLAKMASLADVIKISDEDLCGLFRTEDETQAFQALQKMNTEALYLITRGEKGAQLNWKGKTFSATPPKIEVKDTVGAGDAAMGGLLKSLMENPQAEGATHLINALACGSCACTVSGAGLPPLDFISDIAKKIKVS